MEIVHLPDYHFFEPQGSSLVLKLIDTGIPNDPL
jgi:hypothetical protein